MAQPERFDPSRSLSAWVFTIARKAAIDIYRRERRAPTPRQPEIAVRLSVERMWQAWGPAGRWRHCPDEATVSARPLLPDDAQ